MAPITHRLILGCEVQAASETVPTSGSESPIRVALNGRMDYAVLCVPEESAGRCLITARNIHRLSNRTV